MSTPFITAALGIGGIASATRLPPVVDRAGSHAPGVIRRTPPGVS
ncbi:hypothetical protein [Pelomonas sp. KK5]|nr:hypothetical protein [Pelomonas sp. KK5]